MTERIALVFLWLFSLAGGYASGQSGDPVVMTIAGKDVTRSEFEYSFNKNREGNIVKDHSAIAEYADLFINYKLKVQAALDARMDTLPSFKEEYSQYRDAQLASYLTDTLYVDSVARRVYGTVQQMVGDSDLLLMSQILIPIPQNANEKVRKQAKIQADSVYKAIQCGADFAFMARTYSRDKATAGRGGELPWVGPNASFPEYTANAYALRTGEVSKPFLSTAGYYILKMRERKPLESYERKKPELVRMLKSTGIEAKALESGVRKMMAASNGRLKSSADVMEEVQKKAVVSQPSLKNLFREYYEGLLLYEAVNTFAWKPAAKDKAGLGKFFKKNRKRYTWDTPRFKGFLIRSLDNELVEKALEVVRSCKDKETAVARIEEKLGADVRKKVIVTYGVFKEGDNVFIDQKGFHANIAVKTRYNFDVCGEMIEKPKSYTDDLARVVADYQSFKEQEWVASLRKKYTFSVYKDVLNTVNNH